ncbi:WD40 repeat domain-containing protein [Celerinatantimonas yamalensis]|uniref:Target of rapamycin complex subunit LST8 n=1 Tax=Celerinatantimonas yamalensis TaxID=559956 RepID=A0ABW9GAG3_9GAMM
MIVEQAPQGAYTAALSADGSLSLMSTFAQQVTLWQLQPTPKIRFRWQQQSQNNIFVAKFAPEHQFAITASRHDFAVWSTQTGHSLGFYAIKQSVIRDIALSASGTTVLAGLENGHVLAINLRTGRRLEFLGHKEAINAVCLSANGRYALTAGNGGKVLLWDTQTAQIIIQLQLNSRVTQIALSSDGHYLFAADSHHTAQIYAIPSGQKISRLNIHTRQQIFSSARFVDQGKWLVTGSPNRRIQLWDTHTGQLLQNWQVGLNHAHRPASAVVYDATIDNNGQLISASSTGLVEYWHINQH